MEEAKGARKKALDLLTNLDYVNAEVARAATELHNAEIRFQAQTERRAKILFELEDLVKRCMESFGSDEGK